MTCSDLEANASNNELSPDASSRSTSIQAGNSPIDDITVFTPQYYEETLTALPAAYTVTQ